MITLKDPIYGFTFFVFSCKAEALAAQVSKKLGFIPEDCLKFEHVASQSQGFCSFNDQKEAIVWVAPKGSKAERRSVAIHECAHLAIFVFRFVEMKITMKTTEAFAYYLQWLVRDVSRALEIA